MIQIEVELTGTSDSVLLGQIMRLIGDESVGFQEIAAEVTRDPALAAEVMRMANSNYYGLAGAVGTLGFACSILGSIGLKTLVLTEMGRRGNGIPSDLLVECTAVSARTAELAVALGVDPQIAVAAGLVINLGKMLMFQQDPLGYSEIRARSKDEQPELEVARYGETWRNITVRALMRWSFPADFIEAILEGSQSPLGRVLSMALDADEPTVESQGGAKS